MVKRLNSDELRAIRDRLGPRDASRFEPWPEWAPRQHNACTDECDMFNGPCACGAWHSDGR